MRKPGMVLVALILLAAAAGLAAQWTTQGSRTEVTLERFGLMDGNKLAERAYRDLWSGTPGGKTKAVREAESALVSDMASAYRWCDLGEALLESGAEHKAKYCLARAVQAGPMAPQILMRAANGYFRLADITNALACTKRILALVPVYDQILFSTYTRMGVDIDQALAQGLPAGDPRPARAFLAYQISQHSLENAGKAWAWASARHEIDNETADRYAEALVQAHRYEAAVDAWASYLGAAAGRDREDCVFNGSFEHDPFGETFDWHIQELKGVQVTRDPVASSGRAALRIHFDGTQNVAYKHVRQTVVARPGLYHFEARVRTEGITTDQGVAFRIHEAEFADKLMFTTAQRTGTTGWTILSADINIPPPTTLMTIELVRDRSDRFDSAIGGTAWIDDVKMTRRQR